jgi:hypothetical protein
MNVVRRYVLGLALAAGILTLAACGSNSAPPAPHPVPIAQPTRAVQPTTTAPPAHHYDTTTLELSMNGSRADDGTTITNAICIVISVQADGSGDYQCVVTYSDQVTINTKVSLNSAGKFDVSGVDTPAPSAPDTSPAASLGSPDGSAAAPYTELWLNNALLHAQMKAGDVVTAALCQHNQVDAGGVGTYLCHVTLNGTPETDTITVAKDGTWTVS